MTGVGSGPIKDSTLYFDHSVKGDTILQKTGVGLFEDIHGLLVDGVTSVDRRRRLKDIGRPGIVHSRRALQPVINRKIPIQDREVDTLS